MSCAAGFLRVFRNSLNGSTTRGCFLPGAVCGERAADYIGSEASILEVYWESEVSIPEVYWESEASTPEVYWE